MYKFILIIGPCRSGTTFVLNALSNDQYDGYFQICKHQVREKLIDPVAILDPPLLEGGSPFVAKEALGPYFLDEVIIDPVAELIPPEDWNDSLLVFCLRKPNACYESWSRSFTKNKPINTQIFTSSYSQVNTLYEKYLEYIDSAILILDEPDQFTETLNIIKSEMVPPQKHLEYKSFIKARDPECFEVRGLLEKAMCSKTYCAKKTKISSDVSPANLLEAHTIYDSLKEYAHVQHLRRSHFEKV